jgi:hypothetical protein
VVGAPSHARNDEDNRDPAYLRINTGSLAIFAAIRRILAEQLGGRARDDFAEGYAHS